MRNRFPLIIIPFVGFGLFMLWAIWPGLDDATPAQAVSVTCAAGSTDWRCAGSASAAAALRAPIGPAAGPAIVAMLPDVVDAPDLQERADGLAKLAEKALNGGDDQAIMTVAEAFWLGDGLAGDSGLDGIVPAAGGTQTAQGETSSGSGFSGGGGFGGGSFGGGSGAPNEDDDGDIIIAALNVPQGDAGGEDGGEGAGDQSTLIESAQLTTNGSARPLSATAVPIPGAILLLPTGLAVISLVSRRRRVTDINRNP